VRTPDGSAAATTKWGGKSAARGRCATSCRASGFGKHETVAPIAGATAESVAILAAGSLHRIMLLACGIRPADRRRGQ
jgi:hypothetical protein